MEALPYAVAVHEGIGLIWLTTSLTACYHFKPSTHIIERVPWVKKRLSSHIPDPNEWPRVRKFHSRIPMPYRPDLKRLIFALIESSVIRKAFLPISVPAKLYITYALVGSPMA